MSKTANHATSEKAGKIESKWFKDVFIVKAVMKFSTNNAAEEDWKERPDNLSNICFTAASAESS